MVSVPTATGDSNGDRSGTEKDDSDDEDDEDKGKCNEGTDSDATVNLDYQNTVLKNKELTKQARSLRIQYNNVVKQKEDIVRKHAQALEDKKTAYDGAKTRCHKTEVSELKSTYLKDTYKTETRTKDLEKRCLATEVNQLERDVNTHLIEKLQCTLSKERASLSKVRAMYATSCRSIHGLTELDKKLNSSLKILKKKSTDDQLVKFEHDEKMLAMQLELENVMHKHEKEKRENKEESD
jgi:hypothetical protein